MDLIDRLRPRWRHPDPEVRATAVREMADDDQERLGTIARSDPDARVRRTAIKKVRDVDVLETVAQSDGEPSLRELASERAHEVLVATASGDSPLAACEAALARLTDDRRLAAVAIATGHDAVRRAALGRIAGERALRDVARNAAEPAIRLAALERITDPAALRAVALGDGPPEIALRALERIDDPQTLRAIADTKTAAKAIRRRAQTLLPSEHLPVGLKEGRARQLGLSTIAHGLRADPDVMRAAERIRDAQREWEELARDVEPREDVAAQFHAACDAILEAAASLERRRAEADHVRMAIEDNLEARAALCARVETLDGADAPRELERARAAWDRLAPLEDARAPALEQRFALAREACTERHHRWLAGTDLLTGLEALVGEAEALTRATPIPKAKVWGALDARWARLAGGQTRDEITALRARFEHARADLETRRQTTEQRRGSEQTENLARLTALDARLRELAAAEDLKPASARRELQAAETALADLGPLPATERRAAWSERLTDAHDALLRRFRQLEEAEEWRRWANVGAQEELIRRVEALLESNDLLEGTRQLGRLQDEWASIASATPDKAQALWERFRTVRNELRKRCDAYLAANLEAKRALCAQVADVGDATTWNETTELIKRLQAEWKAIGPVPGRHSRPLWQQFREPCDRFFARRTEHFDHVDAERSATLSQKTALCEQAEALADSTDWEATAGAMKRLQAAWKETGPLPRAQGEALWQRFRSACDRFFDRRSRRSEIEREAAIQQVRAVCDELDTLVASLEGEDAPAPDAVGASVDRVWAEWLRLDGAALDRDGELRERLATACARIVAMQPDSLRGTRLDPDATRKRREKLCTRLEELAGTQTEAPRALSLQEMALALRDRLASNTIAGRSNEGGNRRQDVARELERIDAGWAHLGPALDEAGRALAERYALARARAQALTK